MQQFCYLFAFGDELHILGGYGAKLDSGDGINDDRDEHRSAHCSGHIKLAVIIQHQRTCVVNGVGRSAHDEAGDAGSYKHLFCRRRLFKAAGNEDEVKCAHRHIAAQCADGCAVDV